MVRITKPALSTMAGVLFVMFIVNFAGCAGTRDAMDSRKLETTVKMSETIFLEPVEPEQKIVWIDLRNTSDQQDLDTQKIMAIIKTKLAARGYTTTNSPRKSTFRLQANIRYADREKKGLTEEGMMIGGFGGGLLGSTIGGGHTSRTAGMVGGAVLGSVIGGLAGSMVQVKKYVIVVDLQISEKAAGGVKTSSDGMSQSGGVTKHQAASGKSKYINYRTRVVGTAKKTNLDWPEARPILIDKFSAAIAGVF